MGESKRKSRNAIEFLKQNPKCCFCGGATTSATIDHVPSRQMFTLRRRPKGLEVPACGECNQATRHHEQVAAMLGRLYPDPETEAERAEMGRIMRAVRNNIPGLLEEMRTSPTQQKRFDQAKHSLPVNANALNCNGPLVNHSIQIFGAKLGLALQYATTGRIVPMGGGVAVRWYSNFEAMTGKLPADMLNILGPPETLRQGNWHAADQFQYAYARAENAEMAIYFSTFRRSFAVVSFVTDDSSRFDGLENVQFHRPWPVRSSMAGKN